MTSTPQHPPAVLFESDLGEGFGAWRMGDDEGLLDLVGGANVACGFHAGDPVTMWKTCLAAVDRGVHIGAHVGYRDLIGFGRREMVVSRPELVADIAYQLGALQAVAAGVGGTVRYVKAHGALYNRAAVSEETAAAIVEAVGPHGLPIVCQRGTVMFRLAGEAGIPTIAEVFADRAYTPEGLLAPRSTAGSVVTDPAEAAGRAVEMVLHGRVTAIDGSVVELGEVQAVCVHSDTAGAVGIATAVSRALAEHGVGLDVVP